MSSFAKTLAVVFAGLLATVVVFAADKAADAKAKKPESKESGDKKGKKDKEKSKEAEKAKPKEPEDPDAPPRRFEVPMEGGKGIKIPIRNAEGKLTLRYVIGVAKKVDENHLEMSPLQIETFDANGEHEMTMDLPTAVMDQATWVITAHQPVKIKRDDFELTGERMFFNTLTKQGGLGGNVKMIIYNLFDDDDAKPADKSDAAKPDATATPAPEPNTK